MSKFRGQLLLFLFTITILPSAAGSAAGPLELEVLTFNAYLRPSVMAEGQDQRTPLMAEQLAGRDILLLQEVFSDRHRRQLLDGLARSYPYRTRVLGRDRGFAQDGGVMILSRWPIEAEFQRPFGRHCAGKDCLADKGVLYARIAKSGQRVHVLATHLQSGRDNHELRGAQLRVIRELIEAMAIPQDEAVLLGGDLNVDRLAFNATEHHGAMLAALAAFEPLPDGGRHRPTFDPARNPLAHHGQAQILDYLLFSGAHLQPTLAMSRVTPLFAAELPLSDHFGLQARFVFPPTDVPADRARGPAVASLFAGSDPSRDFLCDLFLPPQGALEVGRAPACGDRPVRAIAVRNLPPKQQLQLQGRASPRRFDESAPSFSHSIGEGDRGLVTLPRAFSRLTLTLRRSDSTGSTGLAAAD